MGQSNGPVHNSCIYKSKNDIATYTEKAPLLSYGEKVYLIKNEFVSEKNFCFAEKIISFKYGWLIISLYRIQLFLSDLWLLILENHLKSQVA